MAFPLLALPTFLCISLRWTAREGWLHADTEVTTVALQAFQVLPILPLECATHKQPLQILAVSTVKLLKTETVFGLS